MEELSVTWQVIHHWLHSNAPQLLPLLNPPAKAKDFAALEAHLVHPLPSEFYELYSIHNGMQDSQGTIIGTLFYGYSFLARIN